MANGIIVKKQSGDGCCFDLLSPDGLVLCRSPRYDSEAACKAAIACLRASCAALSLNYDISQTDAGRFTFTLRSESGEELARGPEFAAEYTCKRGLELIARYAPGAELVVPTHIGGASTGQSYRG